MSKMSLLLCIFAMLLPIKAFSGPIGVFFTESGEQITGEFSDSTTCTPLLVVGIGGWEGTRYKGQGVTSSSALPVGEVRSIESKPERKWLITKNTGEVLMGTDLASGFILQKSDGSCQKGPNATGADYNISFDGYSVVDGLIVAGGNEIILSGLKPNIKTMYFFPNWEAFNALVARNKANQLAAKKAQEAEYQAELARQQKVEKAAQQFRLKVSTGDDTHCGLVIEKKPPIIKIQTQAGEKWFKLKQVYPAGTHKCRFMNGEYIE